jgi:hypothetical protein
MRQVYRSVHPSISSVHHPAAPYLAHLARHGVPAPSSAPPLPVLQQDAAANHGPHPSASGSYKNFILQDMFDYVHIGYWLVLPYLALRGHPSLKIAPSGVVPQRDRCPRPIMDYSFNGINSHSLPVTPTASMQFGRTLQRILQRLAYSNPYFGPPLLAKIDLADGYYCVPLSAHAALQLAVCLPDDGLGTLLLGIPLSLLMGWSLSPPYFCAFTETCTDVTNHDRPLHLQHPFHAASQTQLDLPTQTTFSPTAIFPYNPTPPDARLQHADVYIDDFMLAAQAPKHTDLMHRLLHHINTVFSDHPTSPRRLIVSESKIMKGDATFSTFKRFLGWDLDTYNMTIHLPKHRLERLDALLHSTLASTHTTR